MHYNWTKQDLFVVTQDEGDLFFWTQLLTGDKTDNIPGLKGIGEVKASRILQDSHTNTERYVECREAYEQAGISIERMEMNAALLWMKRAFDSEWKDLISET